MTDPLGQARAAVRDVVPNLVALLRSVPDATTAAVGTWTVGDVAAHLSHVICFDTDAVAGKAVPHAIVTTAGMAAVNEKLLAEDGERDLAVLADRIAMLATEFDDVVSRAAATVEWLQGVRLAPSAVACHLLEECLMHGHDIATATGRPWPIRRQHAVLAVEGGALQLIAALPPTAFVNQDRTFRARIELRLRGGGRTLLVFDGALLGGKLAAWGPRPWKLARMLTAISPS